MLDSIKIRLQYLLLKLGLTRLVGWGADKQGGWLTQLVIKAFARYYHVDMKEAQDPGSQLIVRSMSSLCAHCAQVCALL